MSNYVGFGPVGFDRDRIWTQGHNSKQRIKIKRVPQSSQKRVFLEYMTRLLPAARIKLYIDAQKTQNVPTDDLESKSFNGEHVPGPHPSPPGHMRTHHIIPSYAPDDVSPPTDQWTL